MGVDADADADESSEGSRSCSHGKCSIHIRCSILGSINPLEPVPLEPVSSAYLVLRSGHWCLPSIERELIGVLYACWASEELVSRLANSQAPEL